MMCLYIFVYAKIALLRIFTGCFLRQHVSRMCVIIFHTATILLIIKRLTIGGGGIFRDGCRRNAALQCRSAQLP